ncbi:hypothetical protein J6590_042122 [Homalodisca vitripennis]|nr:hypothetical protein J6590_042122 [Homalodisca vitripennis]
MILDYCYGKVNILQLNDHVKPDNTVYTDSEPCNHGRIRRAGDSYPNLTFSDKIEQYDLINVLLQICTSSNTSLLAAVVAEWLRRLTRNQIPSGSVGEVRSNKPSLTFNLRTNGLKVTSNHHQRTGRRAACKDRISQRSLIQAAVSVDVLSMVTIKVKESSRSHYIETTVMFYALNRHPALLVPINRTLVINNRGNKILSLCFDQNINNSPVRGYPNRALSFGNVHGFRTHLQKV